MTRTRIYSLMLTPFITACMVGDSQTRDSIEPTVRDSAGITITENSVDLWDDNSAWSVAADPLISIGELEGGDEYQLFQVFGATRLVNGTIAIANQGSKEIRFYDATGEYLSSTGGEGEGPGEFQSISFLSRYRGDSLVAYDFRMSRFSVFDIGGEFGRSVSMELQGTATFLAPIGLLPDGSFLMGQTDFDFNAEPGVITPTMTMRRYEPDGTRGEDVVEFEGPGRYRGTSPMAFQQLPFYPNIQMITAADILYRGDPGTYEISLFPLMQAEGVKKSDAPESIVRQAFAPVSVLPEHIESDREEKLERIKNFPPQFREPQKDAINEVPYPDQFPAFNDFIVDPSGNIWVDNYRLPGDSLIKRTVFDSTGRLLGSLDIPTGLRISDIGDDYILGVLRDEFEVEHVLMYEIIKP